MLAAFFVHSQRVVGDRPAVDVRRPDVAGVAEGVAGVTVRCLEHFGGAGGAHRGELLGCVITACAKSLADPDALRLGRFPAAGRLVKRPVPAANVVALRGRAVVEAFRLRHQHHGHHGSAAGGLAEDHHAFRIAAERRDVVADPLQRRHHVEQSVVAASAVRRFVGKCRMGQEAEDVEPVVDRHYHRAVACQRGAVVEGARAGTAGVPAAVNPEEDGTRFRGLARRPDVQEQAVLVLGDVLPAVLHADRTGRGSVAYAGPGNDRCRWPPAQIAHRRRRERYSLERDDVGIGCGRGALNIAAGYADRSVGRQRDEWGVRRIDRRRRAARSQ